MEEKLISVVIPVYNQIQTIENTISSVLNQTYVNIEVIVVDDGSEIDIESVVKKRVDIRISYYKIEHRNANVARNYGISMSKGEYIAMLDADDIWMPGHLADCLTMLENSSADGVYGSLIIRNILSGEEHIHVVSEPEGNESMVNYLLRTGYGAQTSSLFMSTKSARDILWNPELNRHQDYDFVVRFSKKYHFIVKVEPTVIYCLSFKQRNGDFDSCIKFIRENEYDIEPAVYNRYHLSMFLRALKMGVESRIIEHYRREATYYKECLSYEQYIQICSPHNGYKKCICKLKYLYYILRIKVE